MTLEGLVMWEDDRPALVGGVCEQCGTHTFPTSSACPRCGAAAIDTVALPTSGTVWTWTVQRFVPKPPYRSPDPFEPYAVAYVDLGPLKVESRLAGKPADGWAIGDEVALVVDASSGSFAFAPVGEG